MTSKQLCETSALAEEFSNNGDDKLSKNGTEAGESSSDVLENLCKPSAEETKVEEQICISLASVSVNEKCQEDVKSDFMAAEVKNQQDDCISTDRRSLGGRSYQENRRGAKKTSDKPISGSNIGGKYDKSAEGLRSSCGGIDKFPSSCTSEVRFIKGTTGGKSESDTNSECRAKGDVSSAQDGKNVESGDKEDLNLRSIPTEDGDSVGQQNLPADNKGGEELLSLLKKSPVEKKAIKDSSRGSKSVPSRDLKHKGKSASELEAQWKKEAETQKVKENEERQQEEERKRKEDEQRQREEDQKRMIAEEEERLKMEELKSLQEFIAEVNERLEFRNALREQNLKAVETRPDESFFFKLDSNLKKNTTFVKKLRTLTENQKDALVKDFNSLNLTKYIGEVAVALVEAKLKISDINCVLILCSLMHQRYGDFSASFMENWLRVLLTKKDDKVPNPSKLRVDLRLFADLIAVGVFTEKEGLPVLANQLTLLTVNDKEEHNNLTIINSFCKHCGDDYAGLLPQKFRLLAEKYNIEIPRSQILRSDRQKACRGLLKDYYMSLCKHLTVDGNELRNNEKQNRRILQTKGELSTERKEKYELLQLNFQKLLQNATVLADLLDDKLPDLPEEESKTDAEMCGLDIMNPTKGSFEYQEAGENGLFEDEDTRQFYESLPDLKAIIPGISRVENKTSVAFSHKVIKLLKSFLKNPHCLSQILYKDSEAVSSTVPVEPSSAADDDLEDIEDLELMTEEDKVPLPADADEKQDLKTAGTVEKSDLKKEEEPDVDPSAAIPPEVEEDESDVGSSMKVLLDGFLANLPNCVNRELIDKAAIDFCMNLNTKTNRKKLVRTLFFVHRVRYDLLPFYSRLVAILNPCMPSVSADLAAALKADFKYHVRKKDQINIESKLKTVRFIGELVKFNMYSKTEALYCLKMLMLDFTHHCIEMACSLLETCGRFLYRSPESHHRMKIYLDMIMRKKSAIHLDSRYATMIENAFYYSNPPESKSEAKKTRPPMHEYVRKLLYKDLSKSTIEKILRQMRKLSWNDPEIKKYAIHCLTAIWNARYSCIHCCANLLAGLAPYQEAVGIQVVDNVLEDIRLGMEINHPKYNQRRLSTVKYLGELYNYRLVESQVIFRTLYSLVMFGTSLDEATPSPLDPPEHLFRIRLVCILLDTCGQYFDRGSSKKKLDCFLVYFQRYFWCKKKNAIWSEGCPFPKEVDNMVLDLLESIRPKMKIYRSWEEAVQAADEQDNEYRTKLVEMMKVNDAAAAAALPTIQESEEHGDDTKPVVMHIIEGDNGYTQDSDDVEQDEHTGVGTQSLSQSQSQKGDYDDDHHDNDDRCAHDDSDSDDESIDSAGEDMDVDQVAVVNGGLKHIKCQEDDDFLAAFDKMMTETIQARTQELVKIPVVEIAVPVSIKNQQKAKPPVLNILSAPAPGTSPPTTTTDNEDDNFQDASIPFTVLTRRGNKQQFSTLAVPVSETFAAKFREQKEVERAEKERMKRVVLGIHERQEEEDYQEMLAQLNRPLPSSNANRDRRIPYQHQKGAPDADAIFGSKKR